MRFAHPPKTAPYQFSAHNRASGRRLASLSPAQQAYHPCAFSENHGVHLSKMFELESGYWRAQRGPFRPEIGIWPSRDRALLQALATQTRSALCVATACRFARSRAASSTRDARWHLLEGVPVSSMCDELASRQPSFTAGRKNSSRMPTPRMKRSRSSNARTRSWPNSWKRTPFQKKMLGNFNSLLGCA